MMQFGDITINLDEHRVARNGQMIKLGPTEYRLLVTMIARPKTGLEP